ncbi:MAG: fumarylacetoacetate hydrolase family protein [Pseudomonadota bacterium]
MKLITYLDQTGLQRLGALLESGGALDLAAANADAKAGETAWFADMLGLIEAGDPGRAAAAALIAAPPSSALFDPSKVKLCAPLPQPPQIRDFMVFEKHFQQSIVSITKLRALEAGRDPAEALAEAEADGKLTLPPIWYKQPVYYKANRFSVASPDETVVWPHYSKVMDYEFEIACVIGKGGRDIPKDAALDHVFGFTIYNDLSARDAQSAELQSLLGPAKGKDFDKATPMGPCLVTIDEIDPRAIDMITRINGTEVARGSTSTMYWGFEDMISWVSQGETIYPGEILGSGTVGDGCGLERMAFLNDGDVIELDSPQIGVLRTTIKASEGSA